MNEYEVTIYNKQVRDYVRDDKKHPQYDSGWADQRFLMIVAKDADDARNIIRRRHPEHKGFVIVDITQVPTYQ
ncbi:MAG: hypothetical protein COB49_06370 [Alphaproteobacteria bacterium]|nr:MAG: hypothetical protein COB49_06370 [Alphaproteobacteria bacterium]